MRTSQKDLVDRVTGGRLAEIVNAAPSIPAARDILRDEWNITVSVPTLRRWFAVPTEREAS